MKLINRIYCIEGVHDWGKREIEPSVEPLLQLLDQGVGAWEYVCRDCATEGELSWYLRNEWWNRCLQGSILYFFSHGGPGCVSLSEEYSVDLGQLGSILEGGGCEGCFVHFGGCKTMKDTGEIERFKQRTGAWAVSGYGEKSEWTGVEYNSVALEYMLFSSLKYELEIGNNRHRGRLEKLSCRLTKAFPKLRFQVVMN